MSYYSLIFQQVLEARSALYQQPVQAPKVRNVKQERTVLQALIHHSLAPLKKLWRKRQ